MQKSGKQSPLTASAVDLYDKGYVCIPVTTSTGHPALPWKDKLPFPREEVESWPERFHGASLALVAGYNAVGVLDIDVKWEKMALSIHRRILQRWPDIPLRQCNKPKFAIVFRIGDSLVNFKNGSSDIWGVNDQDKEQIEYFGWNKQITVLGSHRKTGNRYHWGRRGTGILDTDIEDLPVLELSDVKQIMGWFNGGCEAEANSSPHWKQHLLKEQSFTEHFVSDVIGPEDDSGDDYFVKSKKVYNVEQVEFLLQNHKGELREDWLKAGRALHSHYEGSPQVLKDWIKWSKQFSTFEEGRCEIEWSYMSDKRDGVYGMDNLKRDVSKDLKEKAKTTVEQAVERYVFIQRDSLVGDLQAPRSVQPYKLADMRNGNKNQQLSFLKTSGNRQNQELLVAWMEHPKRQKVETLRYMPGSERTVYDKFTGQRYWNTYVPPNCKLVDKVDPDHLAIFMDHINYMFEGQDDSAWVLDWLAHMVTMPYERPTVTPLHINKYTRTGRGWLTKIMEHLVNKSNTDTADINKMVDSGAKNGYLANTVLVFVNEAKQEKGNKYAVSDALKSILTETDQNVDIKYGAQGSISVYARFFIQSNHEDALVMDEQGATRFQVFISRGAPRSTAYYNRLYSVRDDPDFINSIYTYLHRRKINKDWLFHSTVNEAKRTVIAASQSPTSQAFFQFKNIVGDKPFAETMLTRYVDDYVTMLFGEDMINVNVKELSFLKKDNLPFRKIRRNGEIRSVLRSFKVNADTTDIENNLLELQHSIDKDEIYA